MATKDTVQATQDEYKDGFNAEVPVKPEQTDDEAFGLVIPQEVSEIPDDNSGNGTDETVTVDASPVEGEQVAEAGGEVTAEEQASGAAPVEPPAGEESGEKVADEVIADGLGETPAEESAEGEMPEMTQNERTWEGRLRKREEELKEREAALANKNGGENADEIDANLEELKAKLTEDFGEEFVNAVVALARGCAKQVASEGVESVSKTLAEVIADIKNSRAQRHFEAIFDVHPDFDVVADSPEFKDWIGSLPADEQAEANMIAERGSAKQINAMLTRFKETTKLATSETPGEVNDQPDEGEVEAAESVRSSGLRLPVSPAPASNDYVKAWEES